MATPAAYIDETKGLTLISQDGEQRETPLCLFTAGDWIDPDRKRQNSFLQAGGDEAVARCLRRTPNFIPRCRFTPFETWFEPIGINELAGDSMKDLVTVSSPPVEASLFHSPEQMFRRSEPMMGMPHYPGVDIGSLLDQVGYRGVRQIASMKGLSWDKGEYVAIQQAFFPDDWEVPIALRLIEQRINEVGKVHSRVIADELLDACNLFRQAAQERINIEHGLLMTRKEHLHTYRYSRLAPQLLAQLEINPKDSGSDITQLAQELVKQLAMAQSSVQAPITGPVDIEAIVAQAVKAALLAHGVGAPVAATEFICDGCDHEPFETAQGLAMHKTRWCGKENEANDETPE
jgi:hypothetical protein